jgi:uncharacterized protein YcbX
VTVAELWRYPVKSMAGERLERVTVGAMGLEGDRIVYVRRFLGRIATARKFPRLLSHRATLGPDGEPLVDGRPWTDPVVAAEIEAIVGSHAKLVRDDDPGASTCCRCSSRPTGRSRRSAATDGACGPTS